MKEKDSEQSNHQSYLTRFYNSLGLWLSLYLIVIAVGFYVIKTDYSFAPNREMNPTSKKLSKSLTNSTNESSEMHIQQNRKPEVDDKALLAIDKKQELRKIKIKI